MRRLVGRTIVRIDLNPQTVEGVRITDPEIHLDDGTSLVFVTEEVPDGSGYGIRMVRRCAS